MLLIFVAMWIYAIAMSTTIVTIQTSLWNIIYKLVFEDFSVDKPYLCVNFNQMEIKFQGAINDRPILLQNISKAEVDIWW